MRNFKKIKAWQHADNLVVKIYSTTQLFPKEELYGLVSQLRRAASSIPANIAEGANRQHKKEYLHFLYVANGSLGETMYFTHLAHRLGYLTDNNYDDITKTQEEVSKTIYGLIKAVKSEA